MGNKRRIELKNYFVIIITLIIGILILTLLNYTGYAVSEPPMKIIITSEFKEIQLGNPVKADLLVYDIKEPTNLTITYSINKLGLTNSISLRESQYIFQDSVIPLEIIIPEDAELGIYQLKVLNEVTSTSEIELFEVIEKESNTGKIILSTFIYLLVLSVLVLIVILVKKHWQWLRYFKPNSKQLLWSFKWKLKQNNFYIKYIYYTIAALILIIIILSIIL